MVGVGNLMTVDFGIYLITDGKKCPEDRLVKSIESALKSGIKAVQLREKDLSVRELVDYAHKIRDLTKKYNALFFVNDRVDVAMSVGADGVHLGQQSIPVKVVRSIAGEGFMIGVSAHGYDEAIEAQEAGADFITLGPVYETPSKIKYGNPIGIDAFKYVSNKIKIPVFAVGGINEKNIEEVIKAGASGVAMISAILNADDIGLETEKIVKLMGRRY
ncbi:MAG TPA: thiamine phosphate synthase [Nitrospirae bacterium]|nr:thiamine phosphate synthase [Nitrospirota bacterium]